ncbi:MAG TPA: integrase arm-type DNA-binding domain-containing protein [Vicinamibacterales bacterium]|jgi:integrase
MARKALTDRFVAGVRRATRIVYFDSKAQGLALRVTPAGTKTWCFVYRRGGKPQWLTLGTYPAVTLADARTVARDKRHAIDVDKRDPVEELRAERQTAALTPAAAPAAVFTFVDLAALYETFAKGRKKTWKDDINKTNKYLIPAWGSLPVQAITRRHVHELLDTLVAKGMTTGVNRIQAVISRLFTVALDRSLVDAHPAARMMKRFQEKPSDRVLTDEELRELWAGLDVRPGPAADAMRLRLLLGQRGGEVIGMRWDEIDLKDQTWTLPGVRTKNGRPHSVPLGPTSTGILERLCSQRRANEDRVFPGLTADREDHRLLSAVHSGAYTWKDLRRTVSTRLAARGFREEVVGRTLNHARYTVTARHYIKHAYSRETRQALETWDRDLADIIAGRRAVSSGALAVPSAQRLDPVPGP